MAKIISINNYKGGVGKTGTAINLAYELAKKYRVLLVDLDPQGDVSYKMSKDFESMRGISELLSNYELSTKDVINKSEINSNLDYITSKIDFIDVTENMQNRAKVLSIKKRVHEVENDYDVIILDNNPNIPIIFKNCAFVADYMLIPVDIYNNSIKGVDYTIQKLKEAIDDSIVDDIKIDYRILFNKVTTIKNRPTNIAAIVMDQVNRRYEDKVFDTYIRLQSKPAQEQSFFKDYFPTEDNSGYGQDYKKLAEEIDNKIINCRGNLPLSEGGQK